MFTILLVNMPKGLLLNCYNFMKFIITIALTVFSSFSFSQEMCSDYGAKSSERRDESRFNAENYKKALSGLEAYTTSSGIDPWPYLVVLEGYLLREQALEERSNSTVGPAINDFCEFITKQGVYRG